MSEYDDLEEFYGASPFGDRVDGGSRGNKRPNVGLAKIADNQRRAVVRRAMFYGGSNVKKRPVTLPAIGEST
jgi:hypothetical protein